MEIITFGYDWLSLDSTAQNIIALLSLAWQRLLSKSIENYV
jgi:hypothetical protein